MSKVERLEAELKLAKLEEKFVAAKAEGKLTRKLKDDLRAARQAFRETYRPQVNVSPDTVRAGAKVHKAGGTS